ncbi:menaquinone biosynthesis protein [Desulfobotulus sp.]|uniref:menaquinone biosynthetic enzyme MqnA/MqnD family protein n=1 Tax=Desulfobotulus sp. TaxID=1940337 RepID=UPI002A361DC7|nr:menaquinone biosynthesis protein [Desulfobotulus sp.]MDY0161656.1 menaquinone biosynthesis protein [Desulfobotulus sp.]
MTLPIRMGRIDYLNVWPVYHGFDMKGVPETLRLHAGSPAALNTLLAEGALDISAISAFAYARHHKDWLLVPDLGIGCDGRVMSVLLVSRFPLEALGGRRVGLSLESASAAHLLRFLLEDAGQFCSFETRRVRRPDDLHDMDGGLVIGDAALSGFWSENFPFIYDLADLWKTSTGHPFVFGLWAVRRALFASRPEALGRAVVQLLESRDRGERSMDAIRLRAVQEKGLAPDTVKAYFDSLHYGLPPSHLAGLAFYFQCMETMGFIEKAPPLCFLDLDGGESVWNGVSPLVFCEA